MRDETVYRIMLTGGGTAGHVYPALTMAEAFVARHPTTSVTYVGTPGGIEARLAREAGLEFVPLEVRGLVGKSLPGMVRALSSLTRALATSRHLLASHRPQLVVGTGGYVSGPLVWTAARRGIATLVQEQNLRPGVTNRILSLVVDRVAVSAPEVIAAFPRRAKLVVTGNPIRPEILRWERAAARAQLGLRGQGPVVLVVGGSQGAASINAAVLELLAPGAPQFDLIWATGPAHHRSITDQLRSRGLDAPGERQLVVVPWVDMAQALAAADLVVSRSGAMTVAELTARGLPAVLVPYPHARAGEQQAAAELLEAHGAAVNLPDAQLAGGSLGELLARLMADEPLRLAMSRAAAQVGRPDAAERLVDEMESLLEGAR